MGTLVGHMVPGSFFIIFGIWWSFVTSMRFILSKKKSPFKKNSLVGYKGSLTMPCIILPCKRLRSAPIESWLKLIFGTIGLLGEVITGFSIKETPVLDKIFDKSNMNDMSHMEGHSHGEHGHGHKRDTPNLPNVPVKTIVFAFENVQHITMYTAFILGSIVEILLYHKVQMPKRIAYVFGIFAFGIEAFLFANHLHSRHMLDIHLHTLLVYAIYGCVICSILESYKPNEIIFCYGRILFTILQGTWFYEAGFILYPPTDNPLFQWDHDNHNQIMTVTASFCWHIFFIMSGLLIQLAVMKSLYNKSQRVRSHFERLIEIDDIEEGRSCYEKNDEETKFFTLISDEDDDNIEFDSTELRLKNSQEKTKLNYSENSSSTSGNHSANISM